MKATKEGDDINSVSSNAKGGVLPAGFSENQLAKIRESMTDEQYASFCAMMAAGKPETMPNAVETTSAAAGGVPDVGDASKEANQNENDPPNKKAKTSEGSSAEA